MKVTQRKMRANYIKPQPPWWDSDCEETKVIKNRWPNNYRGSVSQRELDLYKVLRKEFRNICKHKQNTFKSKHRDDLCTSMGDPSKFWNKLKSGTKIKYMSHYVSPHSWQEFFKHLLGKSNDTYVKQIIYDYDSWDDNTPAAILDDKITLNEIVFNL